ncbi:MAG: class I SAM-dependent methyltransferase [Planctomycetota bacterium]|nr:class I SAM-dependent methyltransferase [Planctomycetota bacterium]
MKEGRLYRQVNHVYRDDYDALIDSGLYESLARAGLLIRHEEADISLAASDKAYKVIKPEKIPFISYPYEWCFSQLKDAALTTLEVQKKAMDCGMCLKDCSAYNVQFHKGKPVFIDTLSFEKYREARPWTAYRQFCQHFLAPLALMSRRDIRLGRLLRVYVDGIPLDLADRLLGLRSRFSFSLTVHIHLHARTQKRYESRPVDMGRQKMSRFALLGLIDSLESAVKKLRWRPGGTEWAGYYNETNYCDDAIERKKTIVAEFLDAAGARTVWDLGANTGVFSRVAAQKGIQTISFDLDPAAVEKNYLETIERGESNIVPLVLDLTNPSAGLGWANEERMSLARRGPADTVMALALIHHLAISNNLPLARVARFFKDICSTLIIEFVPKADSQVRRLLASRQDIFDEYDQAHFERAFERYFSQERRVDIEGTQRTLYLMRNIAG